MPQRLFESLSYVIVDNNGVFVHYEKKFVKYEVTETIGYRIIEQGKRETLIENADIGSWDDTETGATKYTEATLKTFLRTNTGGCCPDSGSGGITSVNGDTGPIVVIDADDINDSSTTNKFVKKLYVNLDSAESEVSRVFAAGRTTFTITHNFNTKDAFSTVVRLSDDRRVGWRIEATTVNTVEASRTGNVSNGLFRILLTT